MLRMMILMLALLSGGAAAWLTANAKNVEAQAPLPALVMEDVLVAADDIPIGTRVKPSLLRWQPWPQEAVYPHFITRTATPNAMAMLTDKTVQSAFIGGEPLQDGKLASGEAGLLSVMLSSGSRAVAVRINAENTAGGFILPNDRVDVLHTTMRQKPDGASEARSRAILRDVRVLAIDQMIDNANGSIVGKTATLELGPEEAETVTAAQASGELTLALRSLADEDQAVEQRLASGFGKGAIRLFRGGREELIELQR